ncbi:hypothetical protein FGO68_gene4421 [Halteria grandinella]|uniref:Uncharacterized protein n=1 Tax=Halteria grandinella TaxID=5974 RepID=A0A8J8SZ66_HALGN|nr:hypothetical protein FGO68_gene4421 [Halteria grandinella]
MQQSNRSQISILENIYNIIMKLAQCGSLKKSLKATLLVSAIFGLVTLTLGKPREYNQCDGPWASEILQNGRGSTICSEGAQLVSLSMIIGGCGITIQSQVVNPSNLNAWLAQNQGFTPDGSIDLKSIEKLGLVQTPTSDFNIIKQRMKYTSESILQTRGGDWFAVRSFSAANFLVNDPRGGSRPIANDDVKFASIYTNRKCGQSAIKQRLVRGLKQVFYYHDSSLIHMIERVILCSHSSEIFDILLTSYYLSS